MSRAKAYFAALKFHFEYLLVEQGMAARRAYKIAKREAAMYAFSASNSHLNSIYL